MPSYLEYLAQKNAGGAGVDVGNGAPRPTVASVQPVLPRPPVVTPFGGGIPQSVARPSQGQMAYTQQANRVHGVPGASPLGPYNAVVRPGAAFLAANRNNAMAYAQWLQQRQSVDPSVILAQPPQLMQPFTPSINPRAEFGVLRKNGVDAQTASNWVNDVIARERELAPLNQGLAASAAQAAQNGGGFGVMANGLLNSLDAPRQINTEEMGNWAYKYWTGEGRGDFQLDDITTSLMEGWDELTSLGTDQGFREWSMNPGNRDKIVNANENGYNGFSGGAAVWELYQAETTNSGFTGMLERGLRDIPADPLNWAALLAAAAKPVQGAGKGLQVLGNAPAGIAADPGNALVLRGLGKATQYVGDVLASPQAALDRGPDIVGGILKGAAHSGRWLARAAENIPVVGKPIEVIDRAITKAADWAPVTRARQVQENLIQDAQQLIATMRKGLDYFGIGEMTPTPGAMGSPTYPSGRPQGPWWNPSGNWDGTTPMVVTGPTGTLSTPPLVQPSKTWTPQEITAMGGEIMPSHTTTGFQGDYIEFGDYSVRQTGTQSWGIFVGGEQVGRAKTMEEAVKTAYGIQGARVAPTGADEWMLFDSNESLSPLGGTGIATYPTRDAAITAVANRRSSNVRIYGQKGGYDGIRLYDDRGRETINFGDRYLVITNTSDSIRRELGRDDLDGAWLVADLNTGDVVVARDRADALLIVADELDNGTLATRERPTVPQPAQERQPFERGLAEGAPVQGKQQQVFEATNAPNLRDREAPPAPDAFAWRRLPQEPETIPEAAQGFARETLGVPAPREAPQVEGLPPGWTIVPDDLNPGDFMVRNADGGVAVRGVAEADLPTIIGQIRTTQAAMVRQQQRANPTSTRGKPSITSSQYRNKGKAIEWASEKGDLENRMEPMLPGSTDVKFFVKKDVDGNWIKGNRTYQILDETTGERILNPVSGDPWFRNEEANDYIYQRWAERPQAETPPVATPPVEDTYDPNRIVPFSRDEQVIANQMRREDRVDRTSARVAYKQDQIANAPQGRYVVEESPVQSVPAGAQFWQIRDTETGRVLNDNYLNREGAQRSADVAQARLDDVTPTSVVETPTQAFDPSTTVSNVPIGAITTDTKRFQPRNEKFDRGWVEQLKTTWDDNRLDPITLWRDPVTGENFVLAGHHRFQAAQELGRTSIPAKFFQGDEAAAIRFAEDSNNLSLKQRDTEYGATYWRRHQGGESWQQIAKSVPGASESKVISMAYASRLPNTLKDEYDAGRISGEVARKLAEAIETAKVEAEQVARFWFDKIIGGKPTKEGVRAFTNDEIKDAVDLFVFGNRDAYQQGASMFDFMSVDFGKATDLMGDIRAMFRLRQDIANIKRVSSRPGLMTELNLEDQSIMAQLREKLREANMNPDMAERLRFERPDRIVGMFAPEYIVKSSDEREKLRAVFKATPLEPALKDLEFGINREGLYEPQSARERLAEKQDLEDFIFGGTVDAKFDGLNGVEAVQVATTLAATELPMYKNLRLKEQAWKGGSGVPLTKGEQADLKEYGKRWDDVINVDYLDPANTGQLDQAAIALLSDQIWKQLEFLDPRIVDNRRWLTRAYDTAVQMWREFKLLSPFNLIRYTLSNSIGDSTQMILHGRSDAAWRWLGDAPKFFDELARHKAGAYLDTAPGRTLQQLELGSLHGELGRGHSQVQFSAAGRPMNEVSAWRRFGNKFGAGVIGKPIEYGRNINNAFEFARRATLWNQVVTEQLTKDADTFGRELAEMFRRSGATTSEAQVYGLMTALTTEPRRDVWDVLPRRRLFGQTDVMRGAERIALDGGLTQKQAVGLADQARRRWQHYVNQADRDARKLVSDVLFDYQYRNIDTWASRIIPFHFWASRALPFYLEQAMRHPGMANGFFRAVDATEKWNEANGAPENLQRFFKVLNSVGGYSLWLNPATAIVPTFMLDTQMGVDDATGKSRLEQWIDKGNKVGVGLYPWMKGMLANAGVISAQFNSDATGTYSERALAMAGLGELARAIGFRDERFFKDPIGDLQGWAATKNPMWKITPGGSQPQYVGSVQGPLTQLNAEIERGVREKMGIGNVNVGLLPESTRTAYWAEVARVQADQDDPIYQAAYDNVLRANTIVGVLRATVPGGKRIRNNELESQRRVYEDGNAPGTDVGGVTIPAWGQDPAAIAAGGGSQARSAQEWIGQYEAIVGRPYKEGDLQQLKDYRYLEPQLTSSTPEWANMLLMDFEYDNLGTAAEQRAAQEYWDVVFASGQPDFEAGDRWLEADPDAPKAGTLIALQKAFAATHPAYAQYLDWRRSYGKEYDGPDGAARYRAETSKLNENARRYYDREMAQLRAKYPNASPAELNRRMEYGTWSIEAYGAVYGIQTRPGVNPLRTDSPTPSQAPLAATGGGTGGGTGSGGGNLSDRTAELTLRVIDYLAQEQQADALIRMVSGDPNASLRNLPPPVLDMFMMEYASQFPALADASAQDVRDYLEWQRQAVAMGTDASVANYVTLLVAGRIEKNRRNDVWIPGMDNPLTLNSGGGYLGTSFSGNGPQVGRVPGITPGSSLPPSYLQSIPGMT